MIIPVDDVAYAACRSPTQKDHPAGHPEDGSKEVNTNSAEFRPPFASTRVTTTMVMTPPNVQKIAKV